MNVQFPQMILRKLLQRRNYFAFGPEIVPRTIPRINEVSQTLGDALPNWKPRQLPQAVTLIGRTCRLEPLNVAKHADDLFAAFSYDDGRLWTHTMFGPFANPEEFREFVKCGIEGPDEYYAIIDIGVDEPVGMIALKQSDPMNGVTECGRAAFSPLLQQSILSTEANFLLMAYVFDQLGYRRYGASCDSSNAAVRKALRRLGFSLDGVFHKSLVVKGRNFDVAWYSITDDEWPTLKAASQAWLAPDNFDKQDRQIRKLEDIRKHIRKTTHQQAFHGL